MYLGSRSLSSVNRLDRLRSASKFTSTLSNNENNRLGVADSSFFVRLTNVGDRWQRLRLLVCTESAFIGDVVLLGNLVPFLFILVSIDGGRG
jgi:hypothetical protein